MRQLNRYEREQVFKRDNHTCRYCGSKEGPFHADHVYPYSRGGETSIENSVTACATCNSKKQAAVGIWPKLIGYWDESKAHVREAQQNGALIMIGLVSSVVGLSLLPNLPDFWGVLLKLSVWIWFGYSLTCAIQWIKEAISK